MEKKNFGYSLKNIPVPNKESYLKSMISKVESFIKRIRWKAYFFEQGKNEDAAHKETFGFSSEKSPPINHALIPFENDLIEMVRNIELQSDLNEFQKQLKSDVIEVNSSQSMFVSADKTTNVYKMSQESYKKLLNDNITATYKKANYNMKHDIDKEASNIAKKLNLDDRIDCLANRDAFITLKDHKDNFQNNPKCRLLNPAKSEIGKISKYHMQRINDDIRKKINVNQWQNTSTVISWFKNIANKQRSKFFQFDIVEFYPSITENLLHKALVFAKSNCNIDDNIIDIIMHARKSLLFNKDEEWMKINSSLFDVTMGSYDGAEVCELVGLFILNEMKNKFNGINIGLYRDDGLGCTENMSGPDQERMKKKIIKLFQENGLQITININLVEVNFLDVTFNLKDGKYSPYRKPNSLPLYINKSSNHPPSIIKELPSMIEKRISDLSCSSDEFDKVKEVYNKALADSGFVRKIQFTKNAPRKNNRKRNIIWFNPPYNSQTKTNIGRIFLELIEKHFPLHHKFRKLFNKNNIKLSYSCTKNMKNIILNHNRKLLSEENTNVNPDTLCNCRNAEDCPLEGNCLEKELVYKASVITNQNENFYLGLTEREFKTRYNNHSSSFRNKDKSNSTSLSKYIWEVKEKGDNFEIKWDIVRHAIPYKCGTRKCDLCLTEKLLILQGNETNMINTRSEIISKCRHGNKFKLKNMK